MAKKWLGRKLLRKNKSSSETKVSPTKQSLSSLAREEPKEEEPQVEEEVQHCDDEEEEEEEKEEEEEEEEEEKEEEEEEEEETQGEEPQGGETQQRWESFESRLSQRMNKSTLKKDTVGQEKGLENMVVNSMASQKKTVWSQLMHDLGENSNSTKEVETFPSSTEEVEIFLNSTEEIEILPSNMDDISDIPSTTSTSSVPFDEHGPPMVVPTTVPAKIPLEIHSERSAGPIIYSKRKVGRAKIVSESDSVSMESRARSVNSMVTSTTPDSDDEKSGAYTASYTRATVDSDSSMSSFERVVSGLTSMFLCYIGEDEPSRPCSIVRCRRRR